MNSMGYNGLILWLMLTSQLEQRIAHTHLSKSMNILNVATELVGIQVMPSLR